MIKFYHKNTKVVYPSTVLHTPRGSPVRAEKANRPKPYLFLFSKKNTHKKNENKPKKYNKNNDKHTSNNPCI